MLGIESFRNAAGLFCFTSDLSTVAHHEFGQAFVRDLSRLVNGRVRFVMSCAGTRPLFMFMCIFVPRCIRRCVGAGRIVAWCVCGLPTAGHNSRNAVSGARRAR